MSSVVPPLPVLVDDDVWPEYHDAVRSLGAEWAAPSGRRYSLALDGRTLTVSLVGLDLGVPPTGEEVDEDLLELAAAVSDAIGGDYSGETLKKVAAIWTP